MLAAWPGTGAMELAPKARRAAKISVFIAFLLLGWFDAAQRLDQGWVPQSLAFHKRQMLRVLAESERFVRVRRATAARSAATDAFATCTGPIPGVLAPDSPIYRNS
jgi:hypothetical protein